MSKANRIISEEEAQAMKDGGVIVIEGQKRLIDEILARKKLKQSYEYEVSFKGLSSSENIWLPRDDLVKRGFEKVGIFSWFVGSLNADRRCRKSSRLTPVRHSALVCCARSSVARLRSTWRTLASSPSSSATTPCAVSPVDRRSRSCSAPRRGVARTSCVSMSPLVSRLGPNTMWIWTDNNTLTDYLDRESLAALIEALKVFEGGVLVITHNRDFSESICKEVWVMRDGRLEASGHNWVEGQGSGPRIDKADGEEDVQYDAMGNKIDVKKLKKISAGEARKVCLCLLLFNTF
jgi:elongation factor 3